MCSDFCVGDLVYVPCENEAVAFRPGVVVTAAPLAVQVAGEVRGVDAAVLRRFFEGPSCPDNTSLVYLNDATILQNLKARHEEDAIYTYTASVLLAVNPYHDVEGLYGAEQCARYRGKHLGALPPHPYAIADAAYRALVREHRNQAFIISGESGAGKTETAKIVMHYLGFASGSCDTTRIQQRIVQAQPILESFGNAVTMRNNNSSRFGKYNRIFFDETGSLVDAGVTTYLLESSRVVMHGHRERSYHCFYEMLSGIEDEKLERWQLERTKRYHLLTSDHEECHFSERDVGNFHRLVEALRVVGFSQEDIDATFQVLAGLVHLGDLLNAAEEGEQAVPLDEETLEKAARLLGLDAAELGRALRFRRVRVAHPGRESLHEVPRTLAQCRHALQSLIKALYKRLFERLVQRINCSFQELQNIQSEQEWREIGILDIYGFERLERNSFEQLCINLANERLQQYFVENVLLAEQELYRREGLPWTGLKLPDSGPVVSAITQTFRILDEYSQQLAKGFEKSDESFNQKAVDEAQKDLSRRDVLKALRVSKRRPLAVNEGFLVKHYAGAVEYNTKGWLDKNNDRLLPECEELISSSSFPLVASLRDEDLKEGPQGPSPAVFKSISKKYVADLENLLQTLSGCQLHYIRCFKPNDLQVAGVFDEKLVLDQIVQCGTVELVRLMHDGYPNRCRFDEMLRFRDLLPENFQRYGTRTFIEALLLAYDVPSEEWALGMSRVFLKAGQLKALEDLRSAGAAPDPERLRAILRGIIRKKWSRACHAVRLCLFLPKFLASIRERRAVAALASRALLVGRLQLQLERARHRLWERRELARRRWRRGLQVVVLVNHLMAQARAKRLQRAMRKFWLLRTRLEAWALQQAEELEQARLEEARIEEERRRAEEEARLEEERRRAAEEEARLEEERRRAEEEARLEEERRKAEEQARLEEERRIAEEAARLEEERRRAAEEARLEEERRRAEEEARLEEERRKAEEQEERRIAEEAARVEEERRRAAAEEEEARLAEERRVAAEAERRRAAEEEARLEEERRIAEEVARVEEERRRAAEEARLEQEQRRAAQEERRCAEEKKALEERRRLEEEQRKAKEEARFEEQRRKAVEEERRSILETPSPCRRRQHRSPKLEQEDSSGELDGEALRQLLAQRCSEVELRMERTNQEVMSSMSALMSRQEAQAEGIQKLESRRNIQASPLITRSPGSSGKERRHSILVDDRRNWAEQRQWLMDDLQPKASPVRSTPRRARNEEQMRVTECFKRYLEFDGLGDGLGSLRSPCSPVKDEQLQVQREWWAQQRRDLFKDLEKEEVHRYRGM